MSARASARASARVPVGLSNLGRGHQFILRKLDVTQALRVTLATPTHQPTNDLSEDALNTTNTSNISNSWNPLDRRFLLPEPPIVVSIGETLGHRRCSSLVEILNQPAALSRLATPNQNSTGTTRAFAKFYKCQSDSQLNVLRQELTVFLDPRLRPYQIRSKSNLGPGFIQSPPAENEEIKLRQATLPSIPRFLGLYAVEQQVNEVVPNTAVTKDESNTSGTSTNNGTNPIRSTGPNDIPWRAAILLEEIPPSFRQINHIAASITTSAPTVTSTFASTSPSTSEAGLEPEGILSQDVVNTLFVKACAALKLIHDNGYLHGDISRGNFLFGLRNGRSYDRTDRNNQTEDENNIQGGVTNADANPDDAEVIILDFERSRSLDQGRFSIESQIRGEKRALLHLFTSHGFSKQALEPLLDI